MTLIDGWLWVFWDGSWNSFGVTILQRTILIELAWLTIQWRYKL